MDFTVVHDLEAKRLLFMTEGRKHGTVIEFKTNLIAHVGNPNDIRHVCMEMSVAYTKDATEILPQAQISFDRFHVIALANETMDAVRRDEMRDQPRVVRATMGTQWKAIKGMFWGMRKDHSDWSGDQINTMYRLQRSNLKSARAWRLKEVLRSTYPTRVTSNCPEKAETALKSSLSWARRSRLEPFSDVEVEKPAAKCHARSRAAAIHHLSCWSSISTQNGIEPQIRLYKRFSIDAVEVVDVIKDASL